MNIALPHVWRLLNEYKHTLEFSFMYLQKKRNALHLTAQDTHTPAQFNYFIIIKYIFKDKIIKIIKIFLKVRNE